MKNTYINKIKSIFRFLFLMFFVGVIGASCSNDTLMEEPPSLLAPENFYNTGDEGVISVNACYQSMKDNFISRGYGVSVYLDSASDYLMASVNQFGDWYNGSLTSSDDKIQTWWERYYTTIGACNITIGRMETSDIEDEIKNRVIAEAKFLRAYNYFHIVQLWGPAPLKTTIPQGSDNMNLPRASIEDIYSAIIEDLKFAEEYCWNVGETRRIGNVSYTNDKGRATKGAAKALLARVYLKIASTSNSANRRSDAPLVNSTGQVDGLEAYKNYDANTYYDLCITKCNEVEALGFALNADFMTNFNVDTKNGIESLFEVQSFGQLDYGSRLAAYYSPGYSGLYGGTWGGTIGVERVFLLNKGPFEIYKNSTYNYRPAEVGDAAASIVKTQFDITDYRYKNGYVHDYIASNQNNRPYKWDIGTARYIGTPNGQQVKFYSSKYIDRNGTVHDDNSNNFILLRFADVLLMKAESLFELGDMNGAWNLIKRVHTRDGNQNMEDGNVFPENYSDWISKFEGTTDEERFREAILYERFIELNVEGHRFFDLCRLGKLEDKCSKVGRIKTRKHYYFPISQIEINANQAISSFHNNPGYESGEY